MAQVFGKGSNSIARVLLIAIFLGFFGFWGVVYAIYRSPYTTEQNVPLAQPVPFSHQHHTAGLGIDCRYCHTSVEKSSFAGLPPTETCMTCHSQVWKDAPLLAPVRNSLATQQPVHWTRVNQLPDFVSFDHSIHVQKGIGCSTCHGRVDQMPITWKAHSLYMRWCLDCHEAPERHVRPKAEIFNMNWQEPADQLARGRELLKEYHVSRERLDQLRDCSMCHR
jgi:Class III cytochrome C family